MIVPLLSAFAGLAAVWLLIRISRREGPATELRRYAGGLVIAAGIYVAFGLVLGGRPLGFELVQLAVFTATAVAGMRGSPLILAGGWMLHSGWDALHTIPELSHHAPEWYVVACLAFDIPLAAYIFARRRSFVHGGSTARHVTTKPVHQE